MKLDNVLGQTEQDRMNKAIYIVLWRGSFPANRAKFHLTPLLSFITTINVISTFIVVSQSQVSVVLKTICKVSTTQQTTQKNLLTILDLLKVLLSINISAPAQ